MHSMADAAALLGPCPALSIQTFEEPWVRGWAGQAAELLAMEIKAWKSTFKSYHKMGCIGRNLIAIAFLQHPCGLLVAESGSIPLCCVAPTMANGGSNPCGETAQQR